MIAHYEPEYQRETIRNRWGETIGCFYLRDGYWEFVKDSYRKEPTLTPEELQWLQKREQELNT